MNWLSKVIKKGKNVTDIMFSVWNDKITDYIDLSTKYWYGKVSFQIRNSKTEGSKYLMIEHRSPEGNIWIPLDIEDAKKLYTFFSKHFRDEL